MKIPNNFVYKIIRRFFQNFVRAKRLRFYFSNCGTYSVYSLENIGFFKCFLFLDSTAVPVTKPKRRAYLLKRKALTTSFFDNTRTDKDKGKYFYFFLLNKLIKLFLISRLKLQFAKNLLK